jgi:hypothetical protein
VEVPAPLKVVEMGRKWALEAKNALYFKKKLVYFGLLWPILLIF